MKIVNGKGSRSPRKIVFILMNVKDGSQVITLTKPKKFILSEQYYTMLLSNMQRWSNVN